MPDQRELFDDHEEAFRSSWAGLRTHMLTSMPSIVTEDSPDGHTVSLQISIKRADENGGYTETTYSDHPVLVDVPVHHPGAGGITHTFPVKKGDEVLSIFASRAIDSWHQNGDVQVPIFNRLHSLSDAMSIPGFRSTPRKLQQVSKDSAQTRTDDKRSVIDHGPNGTHHKTVDPSTAAASDSFDPFKQAKKFFEHLLHPTNGHAVNATDGDTSHSTSLTHADGFSAAASNGSHSIKAHPTNGVGIASTIAHTIGAPNINLDKDGNHSVKGDASVGGNASIKGALSAASGSFGSISGAGGAAIDLIKAVLAQVGSVQASGAVQAAGPVQGASLQSTTGYLVSNLPAPSNTLQGMRVFVTDAVGPTFLAVLQGGGATVCPAFCDGQNWVAG